MTATADHLLIVDENTRRRWIADHPTLTVSPDRPFAGSFWWTRDYVATYYGAVLGPTSMALYGILCRLLCGPDDPDTTIEAPLIPESIVVSTVKLGETVGLRPGRRNYAATLSPHSKLVRSLDRLCRGGLCRIDGPADRFVVRLAVPPVPVGLRSRFPAHLAAAHPDPVTSTILAGEG